MGLLVAGQWQDRWYDTDTTEGRFVREDSQFRNWVTSDGRPGPSGKGGFPAESNRYHLYVSGACPWAHRTLILRKLKGLEEHIGVSVVHPHMLAEGWEFRSAEEDPRFVDHLHGAARLHEIYTTSQVDYTGRVTVPILWDCQRQEIVSNESSEILRMFNTAFNALTQNQEDYFPPEHQDEIERWNEKIYHAVNNGVYRCGFATTQAAYGEAFVELFETLDALDEQLTDQSYLCGNRVTEADWRLFTTLIRFDAVYHGHFKCNRQRIQDYPHLFGYTRRLLHYPGVLETVDLWQIQQHYYYSHVTLNPTRIVPLGPDLKDYAVPPVDEAASSEN